jgi:hypothetical protein
MWRWAADSVGGSLSGCSDRLIELVASKFACVLHHTVTQDVRGCPLYKIVIICKLACILSSVEEAGDFRVAQCRSDSFISVSLRYTVGTYHTQTVQIWCHSHWWHELPQSLALKLGQQRYLLNIWPTATGPKQICSTSTNFDFSTILPSDQR